MTESTLNSMQSRLIGMGVPDLVANAMWNAMSVYSDFLSTDQSWETDYEYELISAVTEWANGK